MFSALRVWFIAGLLFLLTGCLGGGGGSGGTTTPSPTVTALVVTSSATILGMGEQASIQVLASQADNMPATGVMVRLTLTGSASADVIEKETDETGYARFTLTDAQAETVTLTASSGSVTQQIRLYFGATLTLLPTTVNALTNTELTALLKDGNNSPLANQSVNFRFVNNNNETLSAANVQTDSTGIAKVTVTDIEEDGGVALVNANVGTLNARATVNFRAVFGQNRQLEASSNATLLAINQIATITARIIDKNSLPIAGQAVTFNISTLTGGTAQALLSPITGISNAQGEVIATVRGTSAENILITVQADTAKQTIPIYIGGRVQLYPSINNGVADGKTANTLQAIVSDAFGAIIQGVPIHFQVNSGNALLSAPSVISDSKGQALVQITSTQIGTATILASVGTTNSDPASINFLNSHINANIATIDTIVSNNSAPADGNSAVTLTVIVRDNNGNPISGQTVNLLSSSGSAYLSSVSSITGINGSIEITITNTIAETFSITPYAGGKQGNLSTITFVTTSATLSLSASETLLPTGGSTTITLQARQPNNNNPASQQAFTASVSGSARLTGVPTVTDSAGRATFTVTDNLAETVVLQVSSGATVQTLTLYFGASLSLQPTTSTGLTSKTLTALLKDGFNSPLPNQTVTFRFTNTNNETLTPNSAITASDGTATVTITDILQDGGTVVIQANSGQVTAPAATIHFLATFGNNRQLAINSSDTVLAVGDSSTITATITDNNGLPIVGQTVQFQVSNLNGGNSTAQLSTNSGISDAQGKVTTQVTNAQGENTRVTIQADTASQSLPLYFGAQLRFTNTPQEGVADGNTQTTLLLSLNDANNRGIAAIPVYFNATGLALLDQFQTTTDDTGRATIHVSHHQIETVTINAQAGRLNANAQVNFNINVTEASTIRLTSDISTLSLGGVTTLTALVQDAQGNNVRDGTQVRFTSSLGVITATAVTQNGRATATFNASTQAGLATLSASVNTNTGVITDNFSLTIQAGSAGIIEIVRVEPRIIGIAGSGVAQTALLEFLVKDNLGNAVADGTSITFHLGNRTLGGGESIYTDETTSNGNTSATTVTNNGHALVTLKSGHVAGTIDVIATTGTNNNAISTTAQVTIIGGRADADHFSLAVEYQNIAGGVTFGLTDKITAFVGDRFGNIVIDGTAVSFITEGGTIGTSIGGGGFTSTTTLGQATATLQTASPTTPNLGGIPTYRTTGYLCNTPYTATTSTISQSLCGNAGLVRIVAYTTGSESFIDKNGNGQFDIGIDSFTDKGYIDRNSNNQWDQGEVITRQGDLSEPFIDANDNNTFDTGELYIDINSNGHFDAPDGIFQENTTIWTSTQVLFSSNLAQPTITPNTFNINKGGSQEFLLSNISDIYGNALVKGTSITVTATTGLLVGSTNIVLDDTLSTSSQLSFRLLSVPTTTGTYPAATDSIITIKIDSPISNEQMGGNGSTTLTIFGQINTP
ncbi:beta strand repeat-containing protein [Beggiatoa alba]|nr:Ig-like domain-containing protein [Beggiatoa alba]